MRDGLKAVLEAFVLDQSGATAMDYALVASGLSVFVAAAAAALGPQIEALWVRVADNYRNYFDTLMP